MQSLEGQFDVCTETLFDVSLKLEVKEKAYANAEGDVGALSRRILLLEDEEEISEDRLAVTVTKLCKESKRADAAIKGRQQLENAQTVSIEQTDKLEAQLKEAKYMLEESERKFEDISRKLGTLEGELERSTERAIQREEKYQKQISDLSKRLNLAQGRDEAATMNIARLNIKIDQIEESLLTEKLKIQAVSDDLNKTFDDMLKY